MRPPHYFGGWLRVQAGNTTLISAISTFIVGKRQVIFSTSVSLTIVVIDDTALTIVPRVLQHHCFGRFTRAASPSIIVVKLCRVALTTSFMNSNKHF